MKDVAAPHAAPPPAPSLLPPLVRGVAEVVALQVLFFSLLRVVFFFAFRSPSGSLEGQDIAHAFALGARFDLRLALLVALPLFLTGLPGPLRSGRRGGAWLARLWLAAVGVLLTLVYCFDFGHYDWLHERLSAAVLDELRSPREAMGVVWESYPVVWGLLGLAVVAGGWLALAARFRRVASRRVEMRFRRRLAGSLLGAVAVVLGLYGNLSWYPLRWSQAFFSTDPFVSALASNPALYFIETLQNRPLPPDRERVARDYELLADLLEVEPRDAAALSFARRIAPRTTPDFVPNLVVIHLESWAAFQTGVMGNALPSSPHFDELARESLLFTKFFVPSGPTARSVFTMLTGLPDIPTNNPNSSASRDPGLVRQPVLANALVDHEKHYVLGGSANWGNIRALFGGNLPGIEIHEEGSYDRERVDVWGLSDVDLMEEAVGSLDACSGPFFAFIQTSGNHSPYTVPPDVPGFEELEVDAAELHRLGFKSLAAYNGFRFLDHAVGRFFALAQERPWYEHTVFALYGDHGVPAVHGIPYEEIGLVRHHVPLVIHAPALVAPGQRLDYAASSVDILPTCLGLMGVPYVNTALGRDLLAPRPPERRFAFLDEGLVLGEWFLHFRKDGQRTLHRFAGEAPLEDHASNEPARVEELARIHGAIEAWALFAEHDAPRRLAAAAAH